jgi:hypothetical protein
MDTGAIPRATAERYDTTRCPRARALGLLGVVILKALRPLILLCLTYLALLIWRVVWCIKSSIKGAGDAAHPGSPWRSMR